MQRRCCSALLALLLVACDEPNRAAETAQLDRVLAGSLGDLRRAAVEADVLKNAASRASRANDTLTLVLRNGEKRPLANRTDGCDAIPIVWADCVYYSLLADLRSRGFFLVLAAYYEGMDFTLVDDRSGAMTPLDAPPRFAPTGDRFLVLDNNEAYTGGPTIEVWSVGAGGPVREWLHKNAVAAALGLPWSARIHEVVYPYRPTGGN